MSHSRSAKNIFKKIFHVLRVRESKALILVPVHRPPILLHHALNSILKQTEQDFRVHIICDGAPEETNQAALAWSKKDRRFSAHIMEKGPRNGEAYRDPIIRNANANFVCQLADDDLWFPDHLEKMEQMLEKTDFGHSLQVNVHPDWIMRFDVQTVSMKLTRERMLHEKYNVFGPTVAAYRRSAYLRLKEGWTTTPEGMFTDLHMWRKFIADNTIRFSACNDFTSLRLPAAQSHHIDIKMRESRMMKVENIINSPEILAKLKMQLHAALERTDQHRPHRSENFQDNAAFILCNLSELMPELDLTLD